jgi:hypothetical protein
MIIKFDIKTKWNQIHRDEIKKKSSKKGFETKQIIIKRIRSKFNK